MSCSYTYYFLSIALLMFLSLNFSQVEQEESKGKLVNTNIPLNSTYISEPFPVQAYEDPSGPHPPEMLVSLEYIFMTGKRPALAVFLILIFATVAVCWLWDLWDLKVHKGGCIQRGRHMSRYIRLIAFHNSFVLLQFRLKILSQHF